MPMTPFDQAVTEIKLYGFTLVHDVLNHDEIQTYKEALIRLTESSGQADYANRNAMSLCIFNLPSLDPLFFNVIDHPVILPILEYFLEPSLVLGSLSSRIVRPGDGSQDFHSDIPGNMLNFRSPVMMNTVWMLEDFSARNGGTRVVPGSHLSGLDGPPDGMSVRHYHQSNAPAGSVLLFNGQCWHGSGQNTSDTNRYAMFGHYRKSMLMFQLDPHDGFKPEWEEQLTDRQKELMRMHKGVGAPHAADAHVR